MRYSKFARVNGRRVRRRGIVILAALLMGLGQESAAFLETGTLLTNSASATYKAGGQATSVSYSATAKILVANPKLFVWKDVSSDPMGDEGKAVVGSGGGYVTFTICFSNGGANSAFDITITDRLPMNTYWAAENCTDGNDYGAYQLVGPEPEIRHGTTLAGIVPGCPPWQYWGPADPGDPGVFLQWHVNELGIKESACVWYTATITDVDISP